jgi:hypothetical protein
MVLYSGQFGELTIVACQSKAWARASIRRGRDMEEMEILLSKSTALPSA